MTRFVRPKPFAVIEDGDHWRRHPENTDFLGLRHREGGVFGEFCRHHAQAFATSTLSSTGSAYQPCRWAYRDMRTVEVGKLDMRCLGLSAYIQRLYEVQPGDWVPT